MLDYYERRAAEYERIYRRPERQAELRRLETSLGEHFAGRSVLELACGTGWWTPHGAAAARRWLATDLNPGPMEIARAKTMPASVEFRLGDAMAFEHLGDERFDGAFAGCWWSHVERARWAPWLEALHARLQPGARVVFLDNTFVAGRSTPIARVDAHGDSWQLRRLDDGSTHEVLKNYPTHEQALAAVGPRARAPQWLEGEHFWVFSYHLA
ncbi:class I SAM-dependent methyltransferase [Rubrivivax gelatinosus]|uniref:SAM-dependent methyltransferase n=1 Tax=Rubrivivax gelatinosus TaxID=28068 RepID=A0ABS1DWG8_RUBGE|nr:class I SAM-dependent methyltransferase [Rubrivivax gelatinosus]MBK1713965.1 SAM-dependent methyltransferase [Rubrivivax gelatinosus]